MVIKILRIVLLVPVLFVQAQEIASFAIDQNGGLPSNTVYDIFLDSSGFLWVATDNGLARYNGHTFTRYQNNRVRSRSISGLFEDKFGRVWCHNFFGEIMFVEGDSLKKLDSWEGRYDWGFPAISDLKDSLVISTPTKIFSYQLETQTWRELPFFDGRMGEVIRFQISDQKERLWLVKAFNDYAELVRITDRREHRLERNGGTFGSTLIHLTNWHGTVLVFDPLRKILFEAADDHFRDVTDTYKSVLAHTRTIESVGDSILAFMGNHGVQLIIRGEAIELLPGKNVSAVTADREGGVWVATLNEGIFYFPTLRSRLFGKRTWGLFNKAVYHATSNQIIAGQYSGHVRVFSNRGLEKTVLVSDEKEIQSIYIDTLENRLLVFADQLHYYTLPHLRLEATIEVAAVKHVERVGPHYYLATSGGLYRVHVHTLKKEFLPIQHRITRLVFMAYDQRIWVGTQKGIFLYDPVTNQVNPWTPARSVESVGVTAFEVIPGDRLMIGTSTNGVFQVRRGAIERHWHQNDGLPSNHISSLSVRGDLVWVGSDSGISAIDPNGGVRTSITVAKGLASEEVYALAATPDGLWVTHAEGLQQLTELTDANRTQPAIHLKSVTSDGEPVRNFSEAIQLPPLARQLTLEFDVSNSLKSRGTVVIQYRLKGLGKSSWNQTQLASPIVNFLSIPPGDFVLEAVAVNEDGVISTNQLQLPVWVMAPFWQLLWFRLVVGFLLILVAVSIILLRIRRINERQRAAWDQQNLKQELRIAQLTSIRAQMNPHFIFNTMSLIQSKVLQGLKEEANNGIQQFAQLLRRVLDYSGHETIRLRDEIELLANYLSIENARMDGKLDYEISVDTEVDDQLIEIPTLLTQPYVENAVRHGLMHRDDPKILRIRFSITDESLLISIEDNGIGRVTSAAINHARPVSHQSFAMEAYQRRIDLINLHQKRKIEMEIVDKYQPSGQPAGTQVIIKIPLR